MHFFLIRIMLRWGFTLLFLEWLCFKRIILELIRSFRLCHIWRRFRIVIKLIDFHGSLYYFFFKLRQLVELVFVQMMLKIFLLLRIRGHKKLLLHTFRFSNYGLAFQLFRIFLKWLIVHHCGSVDLACSINNMG